MTIYMALSNPTTFCLSYINQSISMTIMVAKSFLSSWVQQIWHVNMCVCVCLLETTTRELDHEVYEVPLYGFPLVNSPFM